MCVNFRQAFIRIFYRPSEVLASEEVASKWAYICLFLFLLWYVDAIAAFGVVTGLREVMPYFVFFYSLFFILTLLILINALYLSVIGAIFSHRLKLNFLLGFVSWSVLPSAVFSFVLILVLSVAFTLRSDALGNESSILMNSNTLSRFLGSFDSYFLLRHFGDIWAIAIQTIGLRAIIGRRTFVCFTIVIIPFVFIHVLIRWCLT